MAQNINSYEHHPQLCPFPDTISKKPRDTKNRGLKYVLNIRTLQYIHLLSTYFIHQFMVF